MKYLCRKHEAGSLWRPKIASLLQIYRFFGSVSLVFEMLRLHFFARGYFFVFKSKSGKTMGKRRKICCRICKNGVINVIFGRKWGKKCIFSRKSLHMSEKPANFASWFFHNSIRLKVKQERIGMSWDILFSFYMDPCLVIFRDTDQLFLWGSISDGQIVRAKEKILKGCPTGVYLRRASDHFSELLTLNLELI